MRILRFRAWDKEENKMVYDAFCITSKGHVQRIGFHEEYNKRLEDMDPTGCWGVLDFSDFYCENWPVMQFTDLLDRNGKEVWESDIFYLPGYETIAVVLFKRGMFCAEEDGSFFPLQQYYSSIEVIGNIYEHPELLEPAK